MLVFTSKCLVVGAAIALSAALCTELRAAEIKVAYAPSSLAPTYKALAADFEAAHPGVRVTLIGDANYDDLTQDILRNSITNTLPDVAHQDLGKLRVLADKGISVPLEPFIASETNWEERGHTKSVEDTCTISGKVYCLPFAISVPVIFYNEALVQKAGGDPKSFPTDWHGIMDLATKIGTQGTGTSGIYFTIDGNGAYPFQILMETAGGDFMSPDEKQIAFDNDAGLFALERINDMREAGMIDMSTDQARQMFSAGKLGIFIINSSNYRRFEEASAGSFKIGVAPLPTIDRTDSRVPVAGNAVVMLAKDKNRQALAWEWIRFATSAKPQAQLAIKTGYAPANSRASELPEMKQFYANNSQLLVASAEMDRATVRYGFPGDNAIRIGDVIEEISLEVLRGREAPAAGLSRMKAEVSKLLEK